MGEIDGERVEVSCLVVCPLRSVPTIDNEFTLKRYDREKGRVVLRPENKAYPVIRPKGNAEIFGVVVGLFRTYR